MRTTVDTNPMTPEEAAVQMERLGHDSFLLDGSPGLMDAAG
jgi:hypothetical protein